MPMPAKKIMPQASLAPTMRVLEAGDVVFSARQASAIRDPWLVCNGQAVSRDKYNALYRAIGTQHGAGDGSTTFNVPDIRGRFVQGTPTGAASNIVTGQLTTVTVSSDLGGLTWNLDRAYLTPIILAR